MKTNWDLTHLYINIEKWTEDFKNLSLEIEEFQKSIQEYFLEEDKFLKILKNRFSIEEKIEKLYCYAKRHVDLNSSDLEMKDRSNMMLTRMNTFMNDVTLLEETIVHEKNWICSHFPNPDLKQYQHYFETIWLEEKHFPNVPEKTIYNKADHILSSLTILYRNITECDNFYEKITIDFEQVLVNKQNYGRIIESSKPEIRRQAFLALSKALHSMNSPLTQILLMKMKKEMLKANIHQYDTVLKQALSVDQIPTSFIENLIKIVHQHCYLQENFLEFQKKHFHISNCHIYDLGLNFSEEEKRFTFLEAFQEMKEALAILGEDYVKQLDVMLEEGWIDVFPKNGKRKDWVSMISYSGVPYICLQFDGKNSDILSLAHETGHAMHTFYSKKQPFEYFEYSLFLAEIASKVNEILLLEHQLEKSIDQKPILYHMLESLTNSVYGQIMLTEFEMTLFEKLQKDDTFSEDFVNETYRTLFELYHSNLEKDSEIGYWWERIPHFFLQKSYYTWKYVADLCIALTVVWRLKHEKDYLQIYLKFLSLGKSVSSYEAISLLGIDLSSQNCFRQAFQYIEEKLHQLETEATSS